MSVLGNSWAAGRTRRRWRVLGAVMGFVLAASAIAVAAWLIGGTGSEYAKGGQLVVLSTNDISATIDGDLFPGGSGDVTISVHNPNAGDLVLTDVLVTSQPAPANCEVTFDDQAGLTEPLPANSDAVIVFADAAHMGSGADNACQGAVFEAAVSLQASTP